MHPTIQGLLVSSIVVFSGFSSAVEERESAQTLISIGSDVLPKLKNSFRRPYTVVKETGDLSFLKLAEKDLPELSSAMHKTFGRCGGFVVEKSVAEALQTIKEVSPVQFEAPNLRQQAIVSKALSDVDEANIRATIEALSSYRNRYYLSESGVRSQEWVGAKWQELAVKSLNAEVQYVEHANYPQRSVILTIPGTTKANEVLVIGGHGDSIAGWHPSEDVEAPGADDNASGIATITEALRVFSSSGIRNTRTIKFVAYAAEEVGLLGSADLARAFHERGENVVGVLQFDMTNYTRRRNEIVLITDYTDARQNNFLKSLITTYLPNTRIQEDTCGYACSDHASWTRYGYPASFAFESRFREHNPKIHTAEDILNVSGGTAAHASRYAQLVLAYLIELSAP